MSLSDAWNHAQVPIIGTIAIIVITLVAFAAVNPEKLQVKREAWSITGNVVLDDALYDDKITTDSPCAPLEDAVCAADGKTYRNYCEARKAGVDIRYKGACAQDGWVKTS